ncbi:MAG TPA: glycosyltransferase family 39 protein [Candidatus Limnocylindrales bacterium]
MGQLRTLGASQDRGRIPRPRPLVLVALAAVALLSLGLQVWGIGGDLPYAPDIDEPIFLQATLRAVHHVSLNPGWFGNPGSTTIYPIAALIEIWYLIAHHVPPFAHPMVSISREFASNPLPFYLIGRLVSVAYGVGSVVALWLLARRILGDVGGVIATLVLPATAIVVAYGHLTRTDTAGLFFALVALWLILRAMEVGRFGAWALAAAAIGLAVSSRYFFATLIVPYGVAAWLWLGASPGRPGIPRALRGRSMVPTGAVLLAPVAFLVTSPFVLLDLSRSVADIRHEARTVHPGADGLSPIGNLLWYLGDIVPATFSPGLILLAILGVIVLWRRNGRALAVLAAFAVSYLLGVSASPLHWDRYVIPLVPVVGIAAAAGVLAIRDLAVASVSRWRASQREAEGSRAPMRTSISSGILAISVTGAILIALLLPPLAAVVATDRLRAQPGIRAVATDWIIANLPAGSRIVEENGSAYGAAGSDVLRVFSLSDRSLDAYRADGFQYLVSTSGDGRSIPGCGHISEGACLLRCARGDRAAGGVVPARPGARG